MGMLHGVLRTATVALIAAIAVLVYVNYFRSNEAAISTDRADIAVAPEIPKLAISPDIAPPAVPAIPPDVRSAQQNQSDAAQLLPDRNASPATDKNAVATDKNAGETMSSPLPPHQPHASRAEIVDNGPAGEVVEIPQSAMPRSSAPASKRTHIVQSGESLWLIAKKYYGNGELYGRIADGNGISTKDRVRVGQVLVIPDQNESIAAKANERPRVSEDLADHEDAAPRVISISSPPVEKPATMSSTFRVK